MEIAIKTVTGRNITLEFDNPELVKHVKVRLNSEMHIFVEAGSPRFILKVDYRQTVGSLKNLIDQTKKTIICVSNMRLEYLGKVLEDSQTLADHDIQDGSILILKDIQTIKIFIKTITDKTFPLDVAISETVRNVKAKIEGLEGIPSHVQRLIFYGKALSDECYLADYPIQELCTLHLVLRLGCCGCC